jgi:hypothetical protein
MPTQLDNVSCFLYVGSVHEYEYYSKERTFIAARAPEAHENTVIEVGPTRTKGKGIVVEIYMA